MKKTMICEVEDESTLVSPLLVTLQLGSTRSETRSHSTRGFDLNTVRYFVIVSIIVLYCNSIWTGEGRRKKSVEEGLSFSPLPILITTLHSSSYQFFKLLNSCHLVLFYFINYFSCNLSLFQYFLFVKFENLRI